MQIIEVITPKHQQQFLQVNVLMNKHNPNYIQPLNKEINDLFNPTTNKNLQFGEAIRWVLVDENNNLIGRIAAFYYPKYINKGTDFKTGCFGFFDCINNQQAANILFNQAAKWLHSKGFEAMDGPINFGDRDKNWGLMVDGFDKEPLYGMAFNPTYYQPLFENYGLKNYYYQYYFSNHIHQPLPPILHERYLKFKEKTDYTSSHISLNNLDKHAQDFATVYNAAYAQHEEGKEVNAEQILKAFNQMKLIIDPQVIWFAYYKSEPIALFVNIPDVNQYFKHFKGKFRWIEKLKLLWMKKRKQCKRLNGIAFAVVPKFQKLGVDTFMMQESAAYIKGNLNYTEYEMGWTGDWNPKMLNVYKKNGSTKSRTMITYRKIFDNKYEFERHPMLN